MSQTVPDLPSDTSASPLHFVVSFTFDTLWTIAPDKTPTVLVPHFPPGGGLDIHPPDRSVDVNRIAIAPVHLDGLSAADVAQVVLRRASDMSRLAQAIAAADIQFAEALQAAAGGPDDVVTQR